MTNLFDIKNRIALVTGGTRGIGKMIASGYVKAGAKVYVTSRSEEACEATAQELSEFGECIAISSDLSTVHGIKEFVEKLTQHEESLDILVNNAGAAWSQPIDEFTEDGWDRIMDLNVKSIFFLTQKLLPLIRTAAKSSGRGRVINIGSIDGLATSPIPGNLAYPASKAAVHHLTRVLAKDFAPNNITVNSIAPGPFESKMTAFALSTDQGRELAAKTIPLGRIGAPDDMIGLSTFLASPAADFITGATIPLDGGYTGTL